MGERVKMSKSQGFLHIFHGNSFYIMTVYIGCVLWKKNQEKLLKFGDFFTIYKYIADMDQMLIKDSVTFLYPYNHMICNP